MQERFYYTRVRATHGSAHDSTIRHRAYHNLVGGREETLPASPFCQKVIAAVERQG